MADTATAPATDGASTSTRPQKPDEDAYKAGLAKAQKDHDANMTAYNAAKQAFQDAKSGRSGAGDDRWKALVDEQNSIRQKQATHKSSRQTQQDKYNQNEAQIKKLIAEQKEAKTRAGFKNVEEIDDRINGLQKQVDSGTMKLVDEKKALTDISSLRRQKKSFAGLDDLQKTIDTKKTENIELKKTFDNAESRQLSETYDKNQKELDEIKASRGDVKKNLDALRAKTDKLHAEQQESYQKIRQVKDDYYTQRKAHKEYEDTLYQQRREKQRAERDAYEKEKRRKIADQRLEEASAPAFYDEIITAEGLIRHFDPSYGADASDKEPGQFAASAQRTVDESGFKGMQVLKKDEEDFFTGGGGKKKKGKGGKKEASSASSEGGKLNMNIGILEELSKVGVNPPSQQSDIPAVVEQLKKKVADWKSNQESQTQKNVEKAKKDIEKLEKEAADESSVPPATRPARGARQDRGKKAAIKNEGLEDSLTDNVSAEAELTQEKDAAADVTKELKDASIEDKENEKVEAEQE